MSVLEQQWMTIAGGMMMGSSSGCVGDGVAVDDRLQELETSFCRDFVCCGQHLPDLHDLLHHYEEHHACCTSELEETTTTPNTAIEVAAAAAPPSTTSNQDGAPPPPMLDNLALDMLCNSHDLTTTIDPINTFFAAAAFPPPPVSQQDDLDLVNDYNNNNNNIESSSSSSSSGSVSEDELRTPTSPMSPQQQPLWLDPSNNNNLDWLMRVNHALLAADACAEDPSERPYRCQVRGCGKAYKNANGLKYHKAHGHCNDHLENDSEHHAKKPYHCAFGLCRKRYKNLNGLKYHIEHTHMAKLRRHL